MTTWYAGTIGLYPGSTLGDCQVSDEWTVQLYRDDAPGVIDVTFAVTFNPDTQRYSSEGILEFNIGEEWSDILRDDTHPYDYDTAEEALPWAENAVREYAAHADKFICWDGKTRRING